MCQGTFSVPQVKCRNYPSGCTWIGQLRDLEVHLKRECPYVLTECSNRCAEVLQRKELSDHLENFCRLRKVQCEYCHIWGAYELIVDEHYDACPKVPVACPNACSEDLTMPREEVDVHIDICPCEKVQCQFKEIGCEVIVARKDMSTHMVSAQGDHLKLTLSTISGMKQALTAYETETAELRDAVQKKGVEQEEIKNLLFRINPALASQDSLSNGALSAMERHLAEEVEVCRDRPFMPVMIKMDNFEQWKSKRDPWYSLPFYTSTFGYKLCLCVYANGTCAGRNTHLSVYVHLMAGEFDDQLDWPIDEDINVELQNQVYPSNHWDVECSFTNGCPQHVTRRVTTYRKVARTGSGSPTFILLSRLQHNNRHQYLKNNSLYFSVY